MLYTRLYTNELPVIKPNTLYIITNDGVVYMQGFGEICKYESGDMAEEAMKHPEVINRLAKEVLRQQQSDNEFDKFRNKHGK